MENFEFYNPTKVIFGKGSLSKLSEEVRTRKISTVLVLYSGSYLEENGVLKQVDQLLEDAGAQVIKCGGVQPNPLLSSVHSIVQMVKNCEVDFILAIGGGSVIDSAKAVSIGLADQEIELSECLYGRTDIHTCLPIGVISTIAGSGSESSCSLVLTIDEGMLKRSYDSDLIRPAFAIMDPELTYSLPKYQMISGGFDILMHTMERYFSPSANTNLIDMVDEALMRNVIQSIKNSVHNPTDYEARANLMWAGSLSHNGLTGTGRVEDWSCHRMEHELSGMFDAVHGAGLCAIWGSWATYVYKTNMKRFTDFATHVMNVSVVNKKDDEVALEGIDKLISLFKDCGMPISIKELGYPDITDSEFQKMARNCLLSCETIGSIKVLEFNDILEIYKNAR